MWKTYPEKLQNKTNYLRHDKLLGTFSIVKNGYLQHYVKTSTEKYLLDNYKLN